MQAGPSSLHQLLLGGSQYIIPVFQRYYSWRKKDWRQLWSDIESLLEPNEGPRRHFMGPLVFVAGRAPILAPRALVIDGQQRLVTLSLFIAAARNIAAQRGYSRLAEEFDGKYLVDPYNRNKENLRILPRQRDRDEYVSIILGSATSGGSLAEALAHFTDHLNQLENSYSLEALRDVVQTVVNGLEFVVVTLDNENPYEIFRSLNATGVPLSEADLIRNFVFMHVDYGSIDRFDDDHWQPIEAALQSTASGRELLTSFFRDFLMKAGKYVSPRAVFSSFEARFSDSTFDPELLAEELATYASYYRVVRGIDPATIPLQRSLQKLLGLDSSTTYPLLLNLYARYKSGDLPAGELADALELLAGFILRRVVCQESSRGYGRWFVAACAQLGDNPVQNLLASLEARGFPSDQRFERAFVHFGLYQSAYARSILLELEHVISKDHKEPADLSKASVEHVMPQTLSDAWRADLGPAADDTHAEWLHTPGNLTVSAYNSNIRNSPFGKKRDTYRDSNVAMNREIAESDAWTREEIVVRGEKLARLAAHIWPGPAEEAEVSAPARSPGSGEDSNLYDEYWQAFEVMLQEVGSPIAPAVSHDRNMLQVGTGREGARLSAHISAGRSRGVGIVLSLTGPQRYFTYRDLLDDRDAIESSFGRGLYWNGRPKGTESTLSLYMQHPNPADRGQWPKQHAWLRQHLERMVESVVPRLRLSNEIPVRLSDPGAKQGDDRR